VAVVDEASDERAEGRGRVGDDRGQPGDLAVDEHRRLVARRRGHHGVGSARRHDEEPVDLRRQPLEGDELARARQRVHGDRQLHVRLAGAGLCPGDDRREERVVEGRDDEGDQPAATAGQLAGGAVGDEAELLGRGQHAGRGVGQHHLGPVQGARGGGLRDAREDRDVGQCRHASPSSS
jgi:hypothetical protein